MGSGDWIWGSPRVEGSWASIEPTHQGVLDTGRPLSGHGSYSFPQEADPHVAKPVVAGLGKQLRPLCSMLGIPSKRAMLA